MKGLLRHSYWNGFDTSCMRGLREDVACAVVDWCYWLLAGVRHMRVASDVSLFHPVSPFPVCTCCLCVLVVLFWLGWGVVFVCLFVSVCKCI